MKLAIWAGGRLAYLVSGADGFGSKFQVSKVGASGPGSEPHPTQTKHFDFGLRIALILTLYAIIHYQKPAGSYDLISEVQAGAQSNT